MGFPEQSLYSKFREIDVYSKLERELQSLSDDDVKDLMKYEPYLKANEALNMVVQGEILRLVRNQVNQYPQTIEDVISTIKSFKENKDKTQKEFINNFAEYLKDFSDMPYQDYLKLKNEKGHI